MCSIGPQTSLETIFVPLVFHVGPSPDYCFSFGLYIILIDHPGRSDLSGYTLVGSRREALGGGSRSEEGRSDARSRGGRSKARSCGGRREARSSGGRSEARDQSGTCDALGGRYVGMGNLMEPCLGRIDADQREKQLFSLAFV